MDMKESEMGGDSPVDLRKKLTLDDKFSFACGPWVPCFTECCARLELLLTPYDVLRLRKRLGLSFDEFVDTYGLIRHRTPHGFPEVMMRMDKENGGRCPFVTQEGCSVYEDRPGACRIYPIGRASTRAKADGSAQECYFTGREAHCKGFEQPKEWTVRGWIEDQGIEPYNRYNDMLMDLYVLKSRRRGLQLGPKHLQMFMMSCYNTDRFRDFVFKSGFLDRFLLDEDLVNRLREDDPALMEFSFRWLKFAFFQEPTLEIRKEVAVQAALHASRRSDPAKE
jgi:Fe-S-cluster containining protein